MLKDMVEAQHQQNTLCLSLTLSHLSGGRVVANILRRQQLHSSIGVAMVTQSCHQF